jgi:GTPase involved in cell partitioning and DNA repair
MVASYRIIRTELEKWSDAMAAKQELIIFSKADICDPEMLEEMV